MSNDRVVITGVGIVSAYGLTTDDFWSGLLSGKSAIKRFDSYDDIKMTQAALVPDYDVTDLFKGSDLSLLDKFSQLAILAARQAVYDSGLSSEMLQGAATIIGSGAGGKHTDDENYYRLYKLNKKRMHPLIIPKGMHSAAASSVSRDLGTRGPAFSIASACASGSHSLITGACYIKQGLTDVAIVGATDAPLSFGLIKAWDALRVVTNEACRPFCKQRSGIVLGEGSGILVIESYKHAVDRGAEIIAEVAGFGMTSDAGHITRPSVTGIAKTMKLAIKNSAYSASSVEYINAHGTGTVVNDAAESEAILEVFGKSVDEIYVSSTKPMHGHALGASSAMEIISTALSLKHGVIPPLINFKEPDVNCDLNFVLRQPLDIAIKLAMTNSFAFGGLNASVLLRSI